MIKIYGIRHKESGSFIEANGKVGWKSQGGAKMSWAAQFADYEKQKGAFDRQLVYEVVELTNYFHRYESLCK